MKKSECSLTELKGIRSLLIELKEYIIRSNLKALGIPPRVITEIVITDNVERFLFFCKELEEPGLCACIGSCFGTDKRAHTLWKYLYENKSANWKKRFRTKGSYYWWKPYSAKPRMIWLEKEINLLNNQINEDTTKKC